MDSKSNRSATSGPGPVLVFCCGGAADVGEISNLAARQLDVRGLASRFCLAGIGGRVDAHLRKTHEAKQVLVIDGCKVGCASKTLMHAGFTNFGHLCVHDVGFRKGESPPTDERITRVVADAAELLGREKV
jgi:uncharacterized metal-binding protein